MEITGLNHGTKCGTNLSDITGAFMGNRDSPGHEKVKKRQFFMFFNFFLEFQISVTSH